MKLDLLLNGRKQACGIYDSQATTRHEGEKRGKEGLEKDAERDNGETHREAGQRKEKHQEGTDEYSVTGWTGLKGAFYIPHHGVLPLMSYLYQLWVHSTDTMV